jgi:DtxR family Mn-dependent transcriptional regulator
MTAPDALTASLEDYLEAISQIIDEKEAVKPKDIAKRLNVSNPSVTGALRSLADKGLIKYAPYDVITLTPAGKTSATDVIRRHEVLRDFFVKVLAVEEHDADKGACEMEHSIPKVILERFIRFAEFVDVCPRGGSRWIEGFEYYCTHEDTRKDCENCISATLTEVKQHARQEESKALPITRLKELKPGQKGKVLKVNARGEVRKRIVEMGVTKGAVVAVERVAPFGDPINIKVKGYHLSLRKEEADGIEVERL